MAKMSKKKKLLWVGATALLLLSAVLVAVSLLPRPRKQNGITQLSFGVGDRLSGYSIYDSEGRSLDIADIANRPTLVVFGMASCRDCIADMPAYRELYHLYNSAALSVVFVWDDEIPEDRLTALDIPLSASYSARGQYKFTDWVPSYYLLDSDAVIQSTTADIGEAVDSLPRPQITPEQFSLYSGGLPVLVGIENCGACRDAYASMEQAGDEFLYCLEGLEETTDSHPANAYADPKKILSSAFGLDVYPVLIYLAQDGTLALNNNI